MLWVSLIYHHSTVLGISWVYRYVWTTRLERTLQLSRMLYAICIVRIQFGFFFLADRSQTYPCRILQGRYCAKNNRHLLFATNTQLDLLSRAQEWFVDGTFKLVRRPFSQLYSFHAFVRNDDSQVQVPLAFVIMSGKSKKDYMKVRVIETANDAVYGDLSQHIGDKCSVTQ